MYGDNIETVVVSDLYKVTVGVCVWGPNHFIADSNLVTVYMIDLWLKEIYYLLFCADLDYG
jgi:hypothetical protein